MSKEFFDVDKDGRKLIHGIEPKRPAYHELDWSTIISYKGRYGV